jgi:lysophospholipase L1-like esterase
VLVQFGHNDMPGKGADRETDPATYRANMARYVDARAAGAVPIIVTSLAAARRGRPCRFDLTAYVDAARRWRREGRALIDLHARA